MSDDFPSTPEVKTTSKSIDNDECIIKGDKYPLVIGQIVKLIGRGDQPRIVVLADPGHGKTFLLGQLAEILHEDLDIMSEAFNPQVQMTQDPATWVNNTRTHRQKVEIVPDADSVFPSDEYYTPKNKANRKVIYLTRLTGNVLCYDAHELAKCDKAIRTNHNIRLVSLGPADNYTFKAEYIQRENDSLTENIISKSKGLWEVDKPSSNTVKRIEELDNDEKARELEEAEQEIRNENVDEIQQMAESILN